MKKTFYEKVGRRYIPVREYNDELMASFPKGTHLVVSMPGRTMHQYDVDPAFAPLIAAGLYSRAAVTDAIFESSKFRPSREPITQEQKTAWESLATAFGDKLATLDGPCANDIAQAAIDKMIDESKKLMTKPAVRKAYEHFLLVCKLTQEKDNERAD